LTSSVDVIGTMTSLVTTANQNSGISFRSAKHGDGAALWQLVRSTAELELNSSYFYLLFATDFGDHCLVAECADQTVGAVIGYRPPREPAAAFVWQIGVAPAMQGQGLGLRMLKEWYALPANCDARFITATVATDNSASDRLFRALAREFGGGYEISEHFIANMFPEPHPSEPLYRIATPISKV
jgi:L-2,4-diaminobutyric acid acetyltransferase